MKALIRGVLTKGTKNPEICGSDGPVDFACGLLCCKDMWIY